MITTKIPEFLGRKRMSQAKLAQITGLNPNTINKIYNDKWKAVRKDTLEKICSALNVDISELFEMTDDD